MQAKQKNNIESSATSFRIRSFVGRNSRKTPAQVRAYNLCYPKFGLQIVDGVIDYAEVFGRQAPCFLEIGFGTGQSLLTLAKQNPDHDFIGIETHQPGIGALLHTMQLEQLENIRIYHGDAVDVLQQCIPKHSLAGLQLFFPDPWPKRRHHARRLLQTEFVRLLTDCLAPSGTLHLATDWEDYARHMLQVLSPEENLINLAGQRQFGDRSERRPILTKFEKRALREGRRIWELQFKKR